MEGKKREERKSQGKNKILTGLPAQSAFRFQQNPNQKNTEMKEVLLAIAIISLLYNNAPAQVKLPPASTTQTIKQDFGLGSIELTYSRPAARGRKVFGDLVPYGKLWRTGANAATRLQFNNPVEIGGKKIDTGTYVLYTIPQEEAWEVIINKGNTNRGIDGYKESEDVVRFNIPALKVPANTEIFTMQFANVKPESCELQLLWEKTSVTIPITTNIKNKLKSQIEAALLTDKKSYWEAAQFYFEFDRNLTKALENITKATEQNPKAYYMFLYKANIQKAMSNNAGAIESSKISLALSKEAKNEDYIRMNERLLKELKRVL
jgi:hypothetical protein